jgi:hypothetical protein
MLLLQTSEAAQASWAQLHCSFLVNTPGAQHMERYKIVYELQLNIFCRF